MDGDLGIFRHFVRRGDAGELLDLTSARLFVEPLRIALLADFHGRIDEDLDKIAPAFERDFTGAAAVGEIGRNERGDDDEPGISHEFADFADAPDIFDAILWREAEVAIQAVADVVAIEHINVQAELEEFAFERVGDRAFARAGKAREPDDRAFVTVAQRTFRCGDFAFAPENVLRFDLRAVGVNAAENDPAARDRALIDEHETTEQRIAIRVVHHERAARADGDFGHVIPRDVVATFGDVFERRGVDDFLDGDDLGVEFLRREFQLRPLADGEVAFAHPEEAGFETVRLDRRVGFVRSDVSAFDENLLGERDADGLARVRLGLLFAAPILETGNGTRLVVWRKDEFVADAKRAGVDTARDDPAVVEAVHVLHRKTQRQIVHRLRGLEGIEQIGDARASVPRHFGAISRGNIEAIARADRDERVRLHADLREERFVFRNHAVENRRRIVHKVHLVHRDDDLLDAEEREQIPMPPRLLAHPFIRRDQQHRRIRARRTGDHVFQELLMPRRVDDDVRTAGRFELNLCRINRDVLLLLFKERIKKERILKLHAFFLTRRLDLLHFAIRQRFRVVENTANERGLAVIDVADENDAETLEICCFLTGHYMNPFARSFCMALRS